MSDLKTLKQQILRLTREYSRLAHSFIFSASEPGRYWTEGTAIPYAGRVFR